MGKGIARLRLSPLQGQLLRFPKEAGMEDVQTALATFVRPKTSWTSQDLAEAAAHLARLGLVDAQPAPATRSLGTPSVTNSLPCQPSNSGSLIAAKPRSPHRTISMDLVGRKFAIGSIRGHRQTASGHSSPEADLSTDFRFTSSIRNVLDGVVPDKFAILSRLALGPQELSNSLLPTRRQPRPPVRS